MAQAKTSEGEAGGQKGPFSAPSISLPKGGGAIRGIGEKFAANPVTGTGSMTIPIASSPGRSGFGPQLALSYDSGAGNGPFGFGWSLSLPAITRKTDKGLPRYLDTEESDVFLLSGAEDLVPVLTPDGARYRDDTTAPGYVIHRYRPRIEGLFARIERWTETTTGKMHWRSITRDNVLTLYGKDNNSRIFDPADPDLKHPARIFSWLICETRDDKGNTVLYEYKPEDGAKVDLAQAHQRNRGAPDDARRKANRYLKHIRYANRMPLLDGTGKRPRLLTDLPAEKLAQAGWMFEVVFDYGEHDDDAPKPNDPGVWDYRADPFSSYRAGFEVRTCRLCQRVLMFHHFPGEPDVGNDCLVRSTDFTYSYEEDPANARNPVYSFLRAVTQTGYRRQSGGYLKRSLPPVEFEYTQPIVQDSVEEIDAASLENLPIGVDGAAYQWTDLHGEGIPGILTEQGGAWFYKRNLSPIGERPVEFAPLELVATTPNLALAGGQAQFLDLAGDGQPDLVVLDGPMPGLYEHDDEESWQPFRPFTSRLHRDTRDPNLKFVDLDGDGHADMLISEDDAFVWHASLGEEGFGPARRVQQALDEEKGPRLVFADGTQSIQLADLSGDGLTDLVRIRNGEICYWPNLGYGRFGAKVTMDNAPLFDHPDQFDPKRIRLADIDGTGTTDVIYLHREGVRLYFNQSGNGWSAPRLLSVTPRVDDLAAITPTDLLGNGTACLVWSSPLPGDARRPMRFVDLMGRQKPHLLVMTINNLGAEIRVDYASSIRFYLQDKRGGKPWITRLPFPVHVVERVERHDHISGNRFVTRYAYHHGYFDGEERELRGFGMVEQWDTEEFAALIADGTLPPATNLDAASHVPPVLTKTWFYTGVYVGRDHVSDFCAGLLDPKDTGEYYREPAWRDDDAEARKHLLPDTVLPPGLTLDEEREACRALKGSMLRQEVYALDGTDKQEHPYTVTEQNFTIRMLQPRGTNRHGVFFTHARESISYHYEREPADPRVGHALTLEVDRCGNVLKSAAINYGRRRPDPKLLPADQAKQAQILITYTENRVTNAVESSDDHRTPLPCESRTFELTGVIEWQDDYPKALEEHFRPAGRERFTFDEILDAGLTAIPLEYERTPMAGQREKRFIEHVRTYYSRNDLAGQLPLGELQSLALPFESYKLAFTPGLVATVFGDRTSDAMFGNEGRYVHTEGDANWWIPSGRIFYSPDPGDTPPEELAHAQAHFFLPHRYRDPFYTDAVSTESFVIYDIYDLLVHETRDALGNQVTVGERRRVLPDGTVLPEVRRNDYRVLQPALVMDPNRNCSEVRFDALGMVVGTAVMGKPEENPRLGDQLESQFHPDLTQAETEAFFEKPREASPNHDVSVATQIVHDLLGNATTRIIYDLDRYQRLGEPAFAATVARETHISDLPPNERSKLQISLSYSDGFGREIQKKIQAEPGPLVEGGPVVSPRWVGSGWTIFNNKGKPVRQYEPFFSKRQRPDGTLFSDHRFEFGVAVGVSPVLFYDPVERVVATLHPNQTWEKVVFDPWRQETWDVNDTVLVADPKADTNVGDFFSRLPTADYLPTWHALRTDAANAVAFAARYPDPTDRTNEKRAAEKTRVHAATPTVAHADSLGRTFFTVAHNKFKYSDAPLADPPVEELYSTRILLDIEGNQREVIDAKDRIVMGYDYDMLGNRVHQASMEAGERWMLNDVAGKPIYAWDSRRFLRRMTYDKLRRPTGLYVTENGTERLAERTAYGESQGDGNNHRTRVYQLFDGAGVVTSKEYDFKGNLLESRRDLLPIYKETVDWRQKPIADYGSFTTFTTYDALNRPLTVTSPDGSVYRPTFNEANLLDRVDVNLLGAAAATPFILNINYNPKGQRTLIEYGCGAGSRRNGVTTTYAYDDDTFRLTHLKTTRPPGLNGVASQIFADPTVVQDLHYTYDPAGNITRIEDLALKPVSHNGQQVDPAGRYTYDALYRLIEAHGREHIGQTSFAFAPPDGNRRDYPFAGQAHPNDLQALCGYTERYEYDVVGNFEVFSHIANGRGWTRRYVYDEDSLLEPSKPSNRLTRTVLGNGHDFTESYSYSDDQATDVHGCITSINSMKMVWGFEDQLQQVDFGGGGTAYYVYDAAGQRVRKVIVNQNGTPRKERIYFGNYEIYREFNGDGDQTIERKSLHVMDDKQRIALVETIGNTSAQRYQLGNHLGSACLELGENGELISYEEYHPYGTTAFQAGSSAAEVKLKRFRYTGKDRDEESGFYYHGARYYAPWLGRWASVDPLYSRSNGPQPLPPSTWEGINSYSYAKGNCISRLDNLGLQSSSVVVSPPNTGALGTEAHQDVLMRVANRINELPGRYYQASTNVRTLPAGSATPGSLKPGFIDLSIFSGGRPEQIYDLKPYFTSDDPAYIRQVFNYANRTSSRLAAQAGSVLGDIIKTNPEVLDPVTVGNRTYYLRLGSRPGFIEYYVTEHVPTRQVPVTYRPAPRTAPKVTPAPIESSPVADRLETKIRALRGTESIGGPPRAMPRMVRPLAVLDPAPAPAQALLFILLLGAYQKWQERRQQKREIEEFIDAYDRIQSSPHKWKIEPAR